MRYGKKRNENSLDEYHIIILKINNAVRLAQSESPVEIQENQKQNRYQVSTYFI